MNSSPGSLRSRTLVKGTTARLISTSTGSICPSFFTKRRAMLSFGPRIFETASRVERPSRLSPSTSRMMSPGLIPARSAGPPSMGETMTRLPLAFIWTKAPMPWNSPSNTSPNCPVSTSLRTYEVWESPRVLVIPLMAYSVANSGSSFSLVHVVAVQVLPGFPDDIQLRGHVTGSHDVVLVDDDVGELRSVGRVFVGF